VKPGSGAAFEAKLFKAVSKTVKSANVEIDQLDKRRIAKNNIFIVPMVIFIIVAGFLIFNVSLGLFGVLWYNINRRKSEIGLRRAVGASGNRISLQFITESLVIASIAVILGLFFAVQFPILKVLTYPRQFTQLRWCCQSYSYMCWWAPALYTRANRPPPFILQWHCMKTRR
jgi:putative ABC transport system permease protein